MIMSRIMIVAAHWHVKDDTTGAHAALWENRDGPYSMYRAFLILRLVLAGDA